MHGNANDSAQECKDAIRLFCTLLELDVLIPENMCKKVEANRFCTTLKKSAR
jgi:hypothetical protein